MREEKEKKRGRRKEGFDHDTFSLSKSFSLSLSIHFHLLSLSLSTFDSQIGLVDVMVAGESLPEGIAVEFIRKFGVEKFRQSYGSTEAGWVTLTPTENSSPSSDGFTIKSSGIPLHGTCVKIVDPVTGTPVQGFNQIGEIYIRGPQITPGYLRNEQANESSFVCFDTGRTSSEREEEKVSSRKKEENFSSRKEEEKVSSEKEEKFPSKKEEKEEKFSSRKEERGSERFFRSGDAGYFDPRGHLFVCDRFKEVIKFDGIQVSPSELESILREHPAVREVAVIGIPNQIHGQVPKGFVLLNFPLPSSSSLSSFSNTSSSPSSSHSLPSSNSTEDSSISASLSVSSSSTGTNTQEREGRRTMTIQEQTFKERKSGDKRMEREREEMEESGRKEGNGDNEGKKRMEGESEEKEKEREKLEEDTMKEKEKPDDDDCDRSLLGAGRSIESIKVTGSFPLERRGRKEISFYSSLSLNELQKELIEFVSLQVAPFKQMRGGIEFLDSFPRTTIGKIDRKVLRLSSKTREEHS